MQILRSCCTLLGALLYSNVLKDLYYVNKQRNLMSTEFGVLFFSGVSTKCEKYGTIFETSKGLRTHSGSQQTGHTSVTCTRRSSQTGLRGLPLLRCPRFRPGCSSTFDQRPAQNWHGQGESNYLIKIKHCDGQRVMLTQCDFCPVLWMSNWRDSIKRG